MTCVRGVRGSGELLVTDVILHLGYEYAMQRCGATTIVSAAFLVLSDRPFFSFSCILFLCSVVLYHRYIRWSNAASSNFREPLPYLGFIALLNFLFLFFTGSVICEMRDEKNEEISQ
jgi:hypothetical protein